MIDKATIWVDAIDESHVNMAEYYYFENAFTDEEINSKTKSLKGVLDPFSSRGNLSMIKRAGFKDFSVIGKFICFEIILAIK